TSVVAAATTLGCTAGFLLFGSGKKFVDAAAQRLATLAVDRRNLEPGSLPAQGADDAARARVGVRGVGHEVGLVENEPARLFVERGIVFLQLERERARVPGRISVRLERREVDEMQQQARARQVAQELVAEPRAFGGALDEPRD